jgi:hypothetical protein
MISFAVGNGGGRVSVGREVVKFCDSVVRALGHEILLPSKHQSMILDLKILDLGSQAAGSQASRPQAAKVLAETRLP